MNFVSAVLAVLAVGSLVACGAAMRQYQGACPDGQELRNGACVYYGDYDVSSGTKPDAGPK